MHDEPQRDPASASEPSLVADPEPHRPLEGRTVIHRLCHLVGECPREGKSAVRLLLDQEEQARSRGTGFVLHRTFAYNTLEDKLIFYNEWSERAVERPFGPDTWVRWLDGEGRLQPESPREPNPKAPVPVD